jgi:hypothetical protein
MPTHALQLLLPNGDPNGLKVISLIGWTGKCFIVPRTNLKQLKDRSEIDKPGLYFLFGPREESPRVYIGESESFFSRITNHDSNKDFWDTVLIFTGELNRADVKYLEFKATTFAKESARYVVENKVQPQENSLSEFDKIKAEQFFENARLILRTFGYEIFEKATESLADTELYYLKGEFFDARARILEDGSLLVLKGALVRIRESSSFGGWSQNARQSFLSESKLQLSLNHPESFEFVEDILFKSPSAAAATITGRSINGWTAWKNEKGITLDENLRK